MVFHDAGGVSRGHFGHGGFTVVMELLRSGEGGLQKSRVADAGAAAILVEHHIVQQKAFAARQPMGLFHFASSRNALR